MVTFSIIFVIALPIQHNMKNKKEKSETNRKNKKHNLSPIEEKDYTIFEVGKPTSFCHIEYILIPDYQKYEIDIVSWGYVAKVYTLDEEKSLQTIMDNDTVWIPFIVNHNVNLSEEQVIGFYNHTIPFSVWTSMIKQGNRAKSDSPKSFYMKRSNFQPPNGSPFCELDESNNITAPISHENNENNLHPPLRSNSEGVKMTSRLSVLPIEEQAESVLGAIEEFKKKRLGKFYTHSAKESKNSSKNNADGSCMQFAMRAEAFFTGSKRVISGSNDEFPGLIHVTTIATVRNLLTKNQSLNLKPLIIHARKLNNLPSALLKQYGISSVYISYKLMNLSHIESAIMPVCESLWLNDAHAILTHVYSQTQLLQFLQTGRIVIELHGVRDLLEPPTQPRVFGQDKCDAIINDTLMQGWPSEVFGYSPTRLMNTNIQPTVLLAKSWFNLSGFLCKHRTLEMSSCLQIPAAVLPVNTLETDINTIFKNNIHTNEINELPKSVHTSPFTSDLLQESATSLDVCVKYTASIEVLAEVLQSQHSLNRLFVILYDREIAISIITKVFEINQSLFGPSLITANYVCHEWKQVDHLEYLDNNEKLSEKNTLETDLGSIGSETFLLQEKDKFNLQFLGQYALTGFVIDSLNKIIIFLEGCSSYGLQDIWHTIMRLPQSKGKTLYNSSLCFEKKLYGDFLDFGGILIITLQEPLDKHLVTYTSYLRGNIPAQCWQAIKQLDLLIKTKTMQSACQNDLFPLASCLLSLNLELGVPLRIEGEEMLTQ